MGAAFVAAAIALPVMLAAAIIEHLERRRARVQATTTNQEY